MLKKFFLWLYASSVELNKANIRSFAKASRHGGEKLRLLDLGCDDGRWTSEIGQALGGEVELHGVEVVEEQAAKAQKLGVQVRKADLAAKTDLPSGYFDVVHSNQVIEHVPNIDVFVSEIFRVLKPGGTAIVSTENGSSWHNIFASILGWQTFSLTNMSTLVAGLGNPLAIHRGGQAFSATWTHKIIFNYLGLIEIFKIHGFREVRIAGAGYHPLPPILGKWDVRHSAFITVCATK
ncbi:MAG: methyltransferase domain-containing protein [Bdellovibrionota bacterium]